MRRRDLLAVLPVLVAATSCNQMDMVSDRDARTQHPVRPEPAIEKALAAVSTGQAHRVAERAGARVVYHPRWSSRIEVMEVDGTRTEIYRQKRGERGSFPPEVVLGFRDVGLAVFDPNHRIGGIRIMTVDGQTWSFDDEAARCPPHCSESDGADSLASPSLAPTLIPQTPALLGLPPAERARASVSTGQAHRIGERAGARVVYHPGWSSRIAVAGAGGGRTEIYRQTRGYNGAHPGEVVLGFRDAALAVFDPNHRIRGITISTLDGQTWEFDEDAAPCPPLCPPSDDATLP